jgi:hypothetical protein
MPLQNNINAPIFAHIDIGSVNKELKAFIQQEGENGIKTAMLCDIKTIDSKDIKTVRDKVFCSTSSLMYISNWITNIVEYILIRTCVLSDKLMTSFLYDFMYLYRTVVHTNIKNIRCASLYIHVSRIKKIIDKHQYIVIDLYKLSHSVYPITFTLIAVLSYCHFPF